MFLSAKSAPAGGGRERDWLEGGAEDCAVPGKLAVALGSNRIIVERANPDRPAVSAPVTLGVRPEHLAVESVETRTSWHRLKSISSSSLEATPSCTRRSRTVRDWPFRSTASARWRTALPRRSSWIRRAVTSSIKWRDPLILRAHGCSSQREDALQPDSRSTRRSHGNLATAT